MNIKNKIKIGLLICCLTGGKVDAMMMMYNMSYLRGFLICLCPCLSPTRQVQNQNQNQPNQNQVQNQNIPNQMMKPTT